MKPSFELREEVVEPQNQQFLNNSCSSQEGTQEECDKSHPDIEESFDNYEYPQEEEVEGMIHITKLFRNSSSL